MLNVTWTVHPFLVGVFLFCVLFWESCEKIVHFATFSLLFPELWVRFQNWYWKVDLFHELDRMIPFSCISKLYQNVSLPAQKLKQNAFVGSFKDVWIWHGCFCNCVIPLHLLYFPSLPESSLLIGYLINKSIYLFQSNSLTFWLPDQ